LNNKAAIDPAQGIERPVGAPDLRRSD